MPERPPFVAFLSDYGRADEFVGVCHAVMLDLVPELRIVDITHEIPAFEVRTGALALVRAAQYLPDGIVLAVVDPGVGTDRRPIAIQTRRGDILVGPDNGLLRPAAERLDGIHEARVLTNRELWLPVTTSTFHGRDIFAPVGAHLAMGTPFGRVGPVIDPAELVDLHMPTATVRDGGLDTAVAFIDDFGNARLAGRPDHLVDAVGPLEPGRGLVVDIGSGAVEVTWQRTFGMIPVGEPLLYEDSFGTISFADNQGNIAARLDLAVDQPARIRPA